MKTITTSEGKNYKRVSRWIRIDFKKITKRHSLYDWTNDRSEEIACFRHGRKIYALNQFIGQAYPEFFEDENGKQSFLCGYDCTDYYNPLMIEIDECGEYCRLYQQITE